MRAFNFRIWRVAGGRLQHFAGWRIDERIGPQLLGHEARMAPRALDFDDNRVVEHATEQRGSDNETAENPTPFGKGAMRRQSPFEVP